MGDRLGTMPFHEVVAESARCQRGTAERLRALSASRPVPPDIADALERLAAWHVEGADLFDEIARRMRESRLFRLLERVFG
jgi:hypothetical protein